MNEATDTNGVEVTPQQHEAIHARFLAAIGSSSTFIGRLEIFLGEMDRRNREREQLTIPTSEAGWGARPSEVLHA